MYDGRRMMGKTTLPILRATGYDINQDGFDEIILACTNQTSYSLTKLDQIHFDTTAKQLIKEKIDIPGLTSDLATVELIDFDNDNKVEILITQLDTCGIQIYDKKNDGYSLSKTEYLDDTIKGNYAVSYCSRDMNDDGILDYAVMPFDGTVRLLQSASNDLEQVRIGNLVKDAIHEDILMIDLDNDQRKDIFIVSTYTGSAAGEIFFCMICSKDFKEDNNFITFPTSFTTNIHLTYSNLRLGAIDVNRDSVEDIAFFDIGNQKLIIFMNTSKSNTYINDWSLR